LCIAIVISTAILEQSGSLALPDSPPPRAATAGIVVLFILIVGLLGLILDQFGITLRSALRDTLLREQELEQSRAALQGRTAELEHEISERVRAEKALQDSEAQYRNLFENNPHPMWVYDAETLAFLAINDAAIQSYGYTREEFTAMTIDDIRPKEDIPMLHHLLGAIPDELTHSGTWRHQKKDGTIIEVEITSHGLVFAGKRARLVLAHDISERKKLEAQFLQAQKMESVGRLAGGVAHDFNNLLTAIVGNLELALELLPPDHPARADHQEIQKAAERATSLTRQLLTFARTQTIAPRVLNLNYLIDNMDKLLRRLIGEDIDLVTLPSPDLAPVRADPGQIEQVIVNLAVNARDAMPEGGKLTIETRNIVLAQSYARQHVGVTPGP
jgi:two-component system cell cycle sensor histidine kinase/response regulator CckA